VKEKFATSCSSYGDKIQPGKEIAKTKMRIGYIITV
jgi:hypothetical protein